MGVGVLDSSGECGCFWPPTVPWRAAGRSTLIGAIGVGGARGSEKDEACAITGLERVKSRLF